MTFGEIFILNFFGGVAKGKTRVPIMLFMGFDNLILNIKDGKEDNVFASIELQNYTLLSESKHNESSLFKVNVGNFKITDKNENKITTLLKSGEDIGVIRIREEFLPQFNDEAAVVDKKLIPTIGRIILQINPFEGKNLSNFWLRMNQFVHAELLHHGHKIGKIDSCDITVTGKN